jgi:DNA-binding NarL/FixJ family response regulator
MCCRRPAALEQIDRVLEVPPCPVEIAGRQRNKAAREPLRRLQRIRVRVGHDARELVERAPRGLEIARSFRGGPGADQHFQRCGPLRAALGRHAAEVALGELCRVARFAAVQHALFRMGVANIINQERDLHVVAEAGDGEAALEAWDRHQPDVTVLDLRMPVMEGVEVVRRIRDRDPRARVIILTTYDTDEEISRALKAGAKAYVLKDISADALVTCIRDVLAGKTYIAPAAAAKLAEGVTRVQLTPRELATLQLMASGKANKEIASELRISERTVKTQLGHLFEKLGVTSRTEAIGVATRRGLVRLE